MVERKRRSVKNDAVTLNDLQCMAALAGLPEVDPNNENSIQRAIIIYLYQKGIFAQIIKSVGTFDPKRRKFRTIRWYYRKGTPDILCFYRGRAVVFELKSKSGRLSPHQKAWRDDFLKSAHQSFYIVARSVDDVQAALDLIDRETSGTAPEP
jgi:penicillin-binding protein-related factor A (putative recombinase)